nr:reverse transcriptase domain-containing protein [Tanacetum cinerariifolium]
MSTRSTAKNLFPPLDNPELTIQRRSRSDPTLLNNSEMAAEGNSDLLVPDLRTMEELFHPSLNGRGGPIAPIAIQETKFGLKNDMIQQSIKVNGVTDDALRLYLFPHSLIHHATAWFDCLLRNSINTFEQMAKMFLGKYFPPSMVTKLRNEITNFCQRLDESLFEAWGRYKLLIDQCPKHNMLPDTSAQWSESSNSITSSSDTKITALKAKMAKINKNLMRVLQVNQQVKAVTPNCETYGGPHSFFDCPATVGNTQNVNAAGAYQEPVNSPIIEPITSLVSAPRPNQKPSTPYPSRLKDQKVRVKANDKREKFFQIFKDLNFNISFVDALILMPKMAECLALADLGASINLVPLFVWNKLYLLDFSPTCMTLELVDHLISCPVGVAKNVFVKVGTFQFLADFVVVDFDADPRVPLILGRYFLKIGRALIDVFKGELAIRVGKEAITFNLDQTLRCSANYNDMMTNRINVIDMDCEEYSDFLLEEVDAFLALEDDPTSPNVNQSYLDSEGDILLIEAFLNDDPSLPPPNQGNYLPQVRKELKTCEAKINKSSIDEPPEEKTALIMVLKSHKRAIAWNLFDIKGNQYYCFLDGFSGYFHLSIDLKDQKKTTFTCLYGTFGYCRMPFGLCNAPGTFQRCMMAIFHDMIEKTMEVFMDDFSVFRNSFQTYLSHIEKMLKRCEDTNLCLNWEKSHFMVKDGIVLGHKISKEGIEVDKAKVDVIVKLPHPTTVKGGTFMKRRPEECYDLIENMTAHHNDWDTLAQQSESSSFITSSSDQEIVVRKDEMAKINKNLMKVL